MIVDQQRIIVAIPALNEERSIAACLESLGVGQPDLEKVRFVVADGGSTDRTKEIVAGIADQNANLQLVDNPAKLQSAGVNKVAEMAEASRDILIRADAHATYPAGYVINLARTLVETQADSVVVPMDSTGATCFARAAAWIVDTRLGSGGSAHRGGAASGWVDHGHHAAMRLQKFREVGGYDARFSHNEDAELDHRIVQAGGRIWLDAGIRLDYQMRRTPGALCRQYWNYGRGRARTVIKHRLRPRMRQLIPVVNLVLLAVSLLILPFSSLGWVWPLIYAAVLIAASVWMVLGHRSACGLWAGVALAIMHNAWGAGFLHGLFTQRNVR
ncbi:MAG: glycosyltransferase family 2 protein [Paracoccus denitrificans]|uniref:Glycosyltransferase family 2 protein n=1 Tax=Paracoccus denitrificans TaxID=266 RepID=A0A533IDJ3_PARDE|nr:MAG: glycosyltransferase family 2 protein [Paracoccus denitrificans]